MIISIKTHKNLSRLEKLDLTKKTRNFLSFEFKIKLKLEKDFEFEFELETQTQLDSKFQVENSH